MTNASNSLQTSLPTDLTNLVREIETLPQEHRERLEESLSRVIEYTQRRRRILDLIQESLSQLRLDMKYLVFDLEATRRERDTYKNNLEGGF
ncbi:MAG TPA: transcriptional regulator [Pirellulaceae bacterium]|nr:transcriptional regulator [Pirellulaceae bacterium]